MKDLKDLLVIIVLIPIIGIIVTLGTMIYQNWNEINYVMKFVGYFLLTVFVLLVSSLSAFAIWKSVTGIQDEKTNDKIKQRKELIDTVKFHNNGNQTYVTVVDDNNNVVILPAYLQDGGHGRNNLLMGQHGDKYFQAVSEAFKAMGKSFGKSNNVNDEIDQDDNVDSDVHNINDIVTGYESFFVYGVPGSGKSSTLRHMIDIKHGLGYKTFVVDPHAQDESYPADVPVIVDLEAIREFYTIMLPSMIKERIDKYYNIKLGKYVGERMFIVNDELSKTMTDADIGVQFILNFLVGARKAGIDFAMGGQSRSVKAMGLDRESDMKGSYEITINQFNNGTRKNPELYMNYHKGVMPVSANSKPLNLNTFSELGDDISLPNYHIGYTGHKLFDASDEVRKACWEYRGYTASETSNNYDYSDVEDSYDEDEAEENYYAEEAINYAQKVAEGLLFSDITLDEKWIQIVAAFDELKQMKGGKNPTVNAVMKQAGLSKNQRMYVMVRGVLEKYGRPYAVQKQNHKKDGKKG